MADSDEPSTERQADRRRNLKMPLPSISSFGSSVTPSYPSNRPAPPLTGGVGDERSMLSSRAKPISKDRLKIDQSIQSSGKLQLSPDQIYDFSSEDLHDLGEIGRGGFGTVNKMVYRKTNTVMAVKVCNMWCTETHSSPHLECGYALLKTHSKCSICERIRSTVDEKEQKQLLMDLSVVMKSNECSFIVQFYGALFKEGDCWICMELMDSSLDKFYKFIYENQKRRIPENILGKITVATVKALNYLKDNLEIIHRDVKPSNILLDRRGNIKLCDFGISGQLVDSIARTRDAGCRPYMAPERIDPQRAKGYDVRSDVWSLGITLMEIATGHFPYPKWNCVFEQLYLVVQGDPPRLHTSYEDYTFTEAFVNFVNTCLIKDERERPKYNKLLEHEFIKRSSAADVNVAAYVSSVLDDMENNGITAFTTNQP